MPDPRQERDSLSRVSEERMELSPVGQRQEPSQVGGLPPGLAVWSGCRLMGCCLVGALSDRGAV